MDWHKDNYRGTQEKLDASVEIERNSEHRCLHSSAVVTVMNEGNCREQLNAFDSYFVVVVVVVANQLCRLFIVTRDPLMDL